MSIELTNPELTELQPRITVLGVGGAGGNAVNNMIKSGLQGVEFLVANTDAQALAHSLSDNRIQLGADLTQGLGAGSKPKSGQAAAEESLDLVKERLQGSHMLFITAGMGGGTGTGAAPVIARAARDMGILTVGVVTKPFQFEGSRRMRAADEGLEELQEAVDTLIIIPNQNLFRVATEKTTFADAFAIADEVLHSGVRGITDLMVMPGLINLDFADVKTVMSEMGKAMMGTGEAEGENRAEEAAEAAVSNPLLDEVSLRGARGVLVNITGGLDLTLFEVDQAANQIRDLVDSEANIIVGSAFNESLNGQMRVSVVATGIDAEAQDQAQPSNNGEGASVVSLHRTPGGWATGPGARPGARPAATATPRPAAPAEPERPGAPAHNNMSARPERGFGPARRAAETGAAAASLARSLDYGVAEPAASTQPQAAPSQSESAPSQTERAQMDQSEPTRTARTQAARPAAPKAEPVERQARSYAQPPLDGEPTATEAPAPRPSAPNADTAAPTMPPRETEARPVDAPKGPRDGHRDDQPLTLDDLADDGDFDEDEDALSDEEEAELLPSMEAPLPHDRDDVFIPGPTRRPKPKAAPDAPAASTAPMTPAAPTAADAPRSAGYGERPAPRPRQPEAAERPAEPAPRREGKGMPLFQKLSRGFGGGRNNQAREDAQRKQRGGQQNDRMPRMLHGVTAEDRAAPEPEMDEQFEIPAFLKRQTNQ
ncbi:cell division protein FtsZ [Rhodothalassium salexigens]|uniref:cell division protein FtsZ n=1 Tax=Rhodothalassium salexigens TaxID=1086 RepID=UPI001912DE3E|nr:cell division protein FtsZ [Rhodothalassium salexigens]MBK5911712.1 cell division protein FtsZ [Rhodothalassium salexigens]MBK5919699.1 cell division protein FtsZ [Rhodothalassium salexigens]